MLAPNLVGRDQLLAERGADDRVESVERRGIPRREVVLLHEVVDDPLQRGVAIGRELLELDEHGDRHVSGMRARPLSDGVETGGEGGTVRRLVDDDGVVHGEVGAVLHVDLEAADTRLQLLVERRVRVVRRVVGLHRAVGTQVVAVMRPEDLDVVDAQHVVERVRTLRRGTVGGRSDEQRRCHSQDSEDTEPPSRHHALHPPRR